MSTPTQFAAKMRRLSTDIHGADQAIVNRAAFIVKKSVQAQLAVAMPSGRLRGVGKKGARVGVRYTLYPHSAKVFMFGPAQLIERDTRPHRIPREFQGRTRRDGTRRKRTKPIAIPNVGVRQWAMHPGTKGKHPWAKGVVAARVPAQRVAAEHYFATVRRALR
jgi:hypothetical protein